MTSNEAIVKLREEIFSQLRITNSTILIINEFSGILSEEHDIIYMGIVVVNPSDILIKEKYVLVALPKGIGLTDLDIRYLLNQVGRYNEEFILKTKEYYE